MSDITLAQVDARLAEAWTALSRGHTSYNVGGRSYSFDNLAGLQSHIDWLRGFRRDLADEAAADAGSSGVGAVTMNGIVHLFVELAPG